MKLFTKKNCLECFFILNSLFLISAISFAATNSAWQKLGVNTAPERIVQTRDHTITVHEMTSSPLGSRAGLTFAWVEFDNVKKNILVKEVLRFDDSYAIYKSETPANALLSINGGFFGYDANKRYIPLGLVISDGTIVNRKIAWSGGGILLQKKGEHAKITKARKFKVSSGILQAVQSKPLIVEDSQVAIYSDDKERFNRTAFGVFPSGRIFVAGAFESFGRAVSLYEFAQLVTSIESAQGERPVTAIAMDGGPGSQIYIPQLKLHYGDPGKNYVPNLVVISR